LSDIVTVRDEGHVRYITLNRPEKKNAISLELAWGVIEAVRAAAADDNVWVVGLTGTGDAFCAGLDLTPGGKPYTPLSPQAAQLDDIGWVGQFVLTRPGPGHGLRRAPGGPFGAADGGLYPDRRLARRGPDHHPAPGHGL